MLRTGRDASSSPEEGQGTDRGRYAWSAALTTGVAVLALPVFRRFAVVPDVRYADFKAHLWWASQIRLFPPRLTMPHPMLHLPTAVIGELVGDEWAIALVATVSVAFTAVVLMWLGTGQFAGRPGLSTGLAAAFSAGLLLVESPGVLAGALRWGDPNSWAATNHMYNSPTETVLVPFSIMLLLLLRRALLPHPTHDFGKRESALLALSTAATVLAKPTLPLLLFAVVPAYLLATRRLDRPRLRFLAVSFLAPGLALVLGQYLFVRSGGAIVAYGRGGVEFRPLATIRSIGLQNSGPLLFSSLLVLPVCLWAGRRRYLREPLTVLTLGSLGLALVALLLLQETGPRALDGNFAKPAFVSWALVNVMSWRFLLGEMVAARQASRWPLWMAPAALLLGIGLAAGTLAYIDALGILTLPTGGLAT